MNQHISECMPDFALIIRCHEMGLGKTVEMLALVLADQWPGLEIQGAGQEAGPQRNDM